MPEPRRMFAPCWTAPSPSVLAAVTIADDLASARWAAGATTWDDRLYAAVALHPTSAGCPTPAPEDHGERQVVAVGETGMDLYWPGLAFGTAAPRRSSARGRLAYRPGKTRGKPLMIHNQDADAEVLDVLAAEAPRR